MQINFTVAIDFTASNGKMGITEAGQKYFVTTEPLLASILSQGLVLEKKKKLRSIVINMFDFY